MRKNLLSSLLSLLSLLSSLLSLLLPMIGILYYHPYYYYLFILILTHHNHSSWTNRILAANDFGAVQVNIAKIDPVTGVYTKANTTYGLSGSLRAQCESDEALTALVRKTDSELLKK